MEEEKAEVYFLVVRGSQFINSNNKNMLWFDGKIKIFTTFCDAVLFEFINFQYYLV